MSTRSAKLNEVSVDEGFANLVKYFKLADTIDLDEGMVAYERYNIVMRRLAKKYDVFTLEQVCAVFCSLSPNSDYWGNLRSTVSCLQGITERIPDSDIVVSTYNHNKTRALAYARGVESFEAKTKGKKILNFYHNILTPHSDRWVTIDGHMVGVWKDEPTATMKDLLIRPKYYDVIAYHVSDYARRCFILPQQMQAILWFVRKRITNTVYSGQFDLFAEAGDAWKTARDVNTIKPYTKAEGKRMDAGPTFNTQWGLFDAAQ
jgi:hypothetical protein